MDSTLVPGELLVPPDAHDRGFRRHDAALVIDGYLRRLASQEARCRFVLGRLAALLLRRQAHYALGFARLDDYARERLGWSGRTLQEVSAVATALARRPWIARAFEVGELTWAHVRALARVATADSEAEWLEVARGRTVR